MFVLPVHLKHGNLVLVLSPGLHFWDSTKKCSHHRVMVKTQFISALWGFKKMCFTFLIIFAVVEMHILLLFLCLRKKEEVPLMWLWIFSYRTELVVAMITSCPVHCRKFFLSRAFGWRLFGYVCRYAWVSVCLVKGIDVHVSCLRL